MNFEPNHTLHSVTFVFPMAAIISEIKTLPFHIWFGLLNWYYIPLYFVRHCRKDICNFRSHQKGLYVSTGVLTCLVMHPPTMWVYNTYQEVLKIPLTPMVSSLLGLRTQDPPLGTPSTWAEIFRHTCLQSHLQIISPKPLRTRIQRFGTQGKFFFKPKKING